MSQGVKLFKTVFQVVRTILQNKSKQEPMPIHFSCSVIANMRYKSVSN